MAELTLGARTCRSSSVQSEAGSATTCRNVERFRGGLVFKAYIFLYHSTLGSRVIKKKKYLEELLGPVRGGVGRVGADGLPGRRGAHGFVYLVDMSTVVTRKE